MPSISPPLPITHVQISSPVHEDGDKKTSIPSHLQSPQIGRETRAYEGLRIFFGSGKKINGQTHSERILSAAKQKDRSKLIEMIEPGKEGTDSLRKLSTAGGTVIGVKYDEGNEAKAVIPAEAKRNSKFITPLMEQYKKRELDPEGKRRLMQGLACHAYTSPVLQTTDGREITFGQLCTSRTWDGITQEDLSRSDIYQRLDSILSDFHKVYEIAASLPQEKIPEAAPKTAKEKGLRKLLKETMGGNFVPEVQRQAGKFNHKAASLFKAKPYEESTLDEVFSLEFRFLKTRNREQIEKKIIENQVRATIKQLQSRPNAPLPSPRKIAIEVKKKSNYQHLAYQDKDVYLTDFIAKVRAAPPALQQPMEAVEQAGTSESSKEELDEYKSADLDAARALWRSHQQALSVPIE